MTLLEMALDAGVPMLHSCGGHASCGTCLVYVRQGLSQLPERTDLEAEMAHDRKFHPYERLSCQVRPSRDLCVVRAFKVSPESGL